jgi:hydroxylamine dehydrogenase
MTSRLTAALLLAALAAAPARAVDSKDACVSCHARLQPGIVSDWELSRHARAQVGCAACHGRAHRSADDVAEAEHPTIDTCQRCHQLQATQFRSSKHARAWVAVKALPTFHNLSQGKPDDPSGCAACHRIGLKTPAEAAALRKAGASHGQASCDACHTRHLFSAMEARQPEACRTCHGSLQYDAWAESKHGTRHLLKQSGRLPSDAAAPTCQVCHLQNGDHANRTPWGNLALRLPSPEDGDPAWSADRYTQLIALGMVDELGGDGPRASAFMGAGVVVIDRVDFQNEQHKLAQACRQCHGTAFVREELDRRYGMVRRADALTASAVREVQALYADGVLPKEGPGPHPDLVKAPLGHPVEQRLAAMFFDHRTKLVATAFHMSPEAGTWLNAMERDLFGIQAMVDELRAPTPPPKKGQPRKAAPAAPKK